MEENHPQMPDKANGESHLSRLLDYLYRFAGTMGNTQEVQLLLEDSLDPLLEMSRAEKVAIFVLPPNELEDGIIMQQNWPELDEVTIAFEELFMLGTEPIGCADPSGLSGWLSDRFTEFGMPMAFVPLTAQGQPVGLLALGRESEPFEPLTLKLLGAAGRQLAVAIENARLFQDLEGTYHRLVAQQEELIRSERLVALSGLAATMAHEIRNPLATIFSSLSQIGKHSQISGDSKTLLGIAEEEALRLNRMVAGLLEFARPRVPRMEHVPLVAIMEEIFENERNREDLPRGVKITSAFPDDEIYVDLDPDLLRKAIRYLVDNAMAAVNPGAGQITIQLESGEKSSDGPVISIVDDGCGIAPTIRGKIFEPFFSTRPSGIGLGLSVARQIIEDHGGTIEIYSQTDKGTTVRLIWGMLS